MLALADGSSSSSLAAMACALPREIPRQPVCSSSAGAFQVFPCTYHPQRGSLAFLDAFLDEGEQLSIEVEGEGSHMWLQLLHHGVNGGLFAEKLHVSHTFPPQPPRLFSATWTGFRAHSTE